MPAAIEKTKNVYAPVYLPELGRSVSWCMCRNPPCENFGIPFNGGPPEPGRTAVSDDRYRIDTRDHRIRCRSCGMSFTARSNAAIRPLVRHFLRLTLPFADCPNTNCANHGINVFEHATTRQRYRRRGRAKPRYRAESEYMVRCTECHARFVIGSALFLKNTRRVGAFIEGILDKRSASDTMERLVMGAGSYYSHLQRISARLRDWVAYQSAKLMRARYRKWPKPLRAYTDTMRTSIRRPGEGERAKQIDLVSSVVAVKHDAPDLSRKDRRSHFVFAAHPCFLPDKHGPDDRELLSAIASPDPMGMWACLEYGFGGPAKMEVDRAMRTLSDQSSPGFFTNSPYSELAHFLVLGKLASRFPKVYLYMDGAVPLYTAALTAFASDIRAGRVEIALFQHEKDYVPVKKRRAARRTGSASKKVRRRKLDRAWALVESELDKRGRGELPFATGARTDHAAVAKEFKSAFKGAYSETGEWAWLKGVVPKGSYRGPRVLWLTWHPTKRYKTEGRPLLRQATLQSVDSAFNSFRNRARGMARAAASPSSGRDYNQTYVHPDSVMAEFWMVLLDFNHTGRKRRRKPIRATAFELGEVSGGAEEMTDIALNFRLGMTHAGEVTRWRSR